MASAFAHALSDWRRNLRLLRRHVRHGRASWGSGSNAAKVCEIAALFRTVNDLLRELEVDYFLTYGTLLGWLRDGRPLAHDVDLDFAAPVEAYPKIRAIGPKLPKGYWLEDTSHLHPGPKLFVDYRGWKADIYFLGEAGEGQIRTLEQSNNPGDMLPYPREWFFPAQPSVFLGEPTFIPAQPVEYLEHVYHYLGPDAERDPVTRYFRPRTPPGGE